jgi:hypothetical protein
MGGIAEGRVPENLVVGSFFRKPLGVFAATLVVGCALLAVGMAAFGGTSGTSSSYHPPTPLTPAQFRKAGERIGMSVCLQLKPIVNKKPRNLREVARGMRGITAIFDGLRMKLYGLVPPASAAASFQRLRKNFDALDGAFRRLDHLAATRQWRRFVLLARSKWFKDIARRFGPIKKVGKLQCGQPGTIT